MSIKLRLYHVLQGQSTVHYDLCTQNVQDWCLQMSLWDSFTNMKTAVYSGGFIQCTVFPEDRILHSKLITIICKNHTFVEVLYFNLSFALFTKASCNEVISRQFLTILCIRVIWFLFVHGVWECGPEHSQTDSASRGCSVGGSSGSTLPAGYLIIEMFRFHPRWQTVAPAADRRWWNVVL